MKDVKARLLTIEDGLKVLQEFAGKLLHLHKDTNIDVGKHHLVVDGLKQGVSTINKLICQVDSLKATFSIPISLSLSNLRTQIYLEMWNVPIIVVVKCFQHIKIFLGWSLNNIILRCSTDLNTTLLNWGSLPPLYSFALWIKSCWLLL